MGGWWFAAGTIPDYQTSNNRKLIALLYHYLSKPENHFNIAELCFNLTENIPRLHYKDQLSYSLKRNNRRENEMTLIKARTIYDQKAQLFKG